jgi:hypothetical protein
MKNLFKGLAILCVAVLAAPAARAADDVPNFNKRGDSEKRFVEKVGHLIVKTAHKTIKDPDVRNYKFKEVKPGRTKLEMEIGYKGGVLGTKYTANVTVNLDTSDKDKWEVLSIDYEDNNKIPYSKSGVTDLVKAFNKASQ